MIVMKFGGSSVGSAEAIRQVARIIGRFLDRSPVVVVSAMAGVTDLLLSLIAARAEGDESTFEGIFEKLRAVHNEALAGLLSAGGDPVLQAQVPLLLRRLEEELQTPAVNEEGAATVSDEVLSYGERLASYLVAVALRAEGIKARPYDARGLVFTDLNGNVKKELSYPAIDTALRPSVEDGIVPVVTGFIARRSDGRTVTLGRGGSDYTATLLGAALKADEVWYWKEVDGVMTADPKVVPGALLIGNLTYDEAAEMSYFGAKVLHSRTMIPVVRKGIPIRIRNTFDPDAHGTIIGPDADEPPSGVRAVTAIRDLAIVTVEGKGMAGIAGFAGRVFTAAGRIGANLPMFNQASSEQSICLVCAVTDADRLGKELRSELKEQIAAGIVEGVSVEKGFAAVAVVGEGMRGRKGVAGRFLTAVGGADVNVYAITQGASERIISIIVRDEDADVAVRAVHAAFGLGGEKEDTDE